MFGYVVVNKPEMKVKDFDRYREYYCGICHALGERHNNISRISLSYDSTFAAILLTALYEPGNVRVRRNCILYPFKKQITLKNPYIDYIGDMNLVLSYYKCIDDYVDEKDLLKYTYGNLIKKEVNIIKEKYPKKIKCIGNNIKKLSRLESTGCTNIDELSGVFGDIMGEIFAVSPEEVIENYASSVRETRWKSTLRELGYALGKYIYIMDAFDDVEKDIKEGNFNPFISRYNEEQEIIAGIVYQKDDYIPFQDWVKKLLMIFATDVADAYERLPIVDEVGILRNIIYSGIWTKYFSVCERRRKDERSL